MNTSNEVGTWKWPLMNGLIGPAKSEIRVSNSLDQQGQDKVASEYISKVNLATDTRTEAHVTSNKPAKATVNASSWHSLPDWAHNSAAGRQMTLHYGFKLLVVKHCFTETVFLSRTNRTMTFNAIFNRFIFNFICWKLNLMSTSENSPDSFAKCALIWNFQIKCPTLFAYLNNFLIK